jgi:hypothetical protein
LKVSSNLLIASKKACGLSTSPVLSCWNGIAASSSRPRVERSSAIATRLPPLVA